MLVYTLSILRDGLPLIRLCLFCQLLREEGHELGITEQGLLETSVSLTVNGASRQSGRDELVSGQQTIGADVLDHSKFL